MEIKNNTIITLDNNMQYVVLSKTIYENNKYFLMMGMKNNEVISNDVAIFKEENEGLDTYVVKVTDPSLMQTLTNLLKSQME